MFTRYRAVLGRPGALRFSVTAMVARLPISIDTLGIVLLVTGLGRSYGLAGALTAAYTIANGAMAIVQGRLLDRLGQARVLPVVASLFGVAIVVLVVTLQSGWPDPVAFAAAALAGAAYPPIGSCVRARWSYVLAGEPTEIQTAYALESVIDEAIFIIGPTIATVLATTWRPWAGLAIALVSGVGGSLYLAAQRGTQPAAAASRPCDGRPAVDAVALGGAARRGLLRPGLDVRGRRGRAPSRSPASRTPSRTPGCCWLPGRSAACSPGW